MIFTMLRAPPKKMLLLFLLLQPMSCLFFCFSLGEDLVVLDQLRIQSEIFLEPCSLSFSSLSSCLLMRWIMWLENWGKGLSCNDDLLNLMNLLLLLLLLYWCYCSILSSSATPTTCWCSLLSCLFSVLYFCYYYNNNYDGWLFSSLPLGNGPLLCCFLREETWDLYVLAWG